MGLFDVFTAGSASKAAAQNRQAISDGLASGTNALNAGTANALGLLGTGNGATAFSQLSTMYDRGREALQGGFGQAQSYLGQVGQLYDPLVSSGQSALGVRDDALGLNGEEGYGRAKQAFVNSLGYGAGLNEGLDSVMRSASARGNLAGGNTSRDLFNYAADYQNRQAGSFMDRLTGASQNLNQGIAGRAGALGAQATTAQGLGSGLAEMDQTQGGRLGDLYAQGANAYLGQGRGIADLNSQATQSSISNNNMLAQAKTAGSSNLFNLGANILSGGNLAKLKEVFK